MYNKSANVLTAACLRPVATYICRRRHNITKNIESWTLLQECRGAETQGGSLSFQMWWQQEMNPEEGDVGGAGEGEGGVFPQRFFDEAGDEVDAGHKANVNWTDPCGCHMDRPNTPP